MNIALRVWREVCAGGKFRSVGESLCDDPPDCENTCDEAGNETGEEANEQTGAEIDKPFRMNGAEQPLDPLHTLLEPETSRSFKDEFIELAFDASYVFWLATANGSSSILPAVLDRFLVLDIVAPQASQMRVMIEAIVGDAMAQFPDWFDSCIAHDVVARLSALHPRRLRQVAALACTHAVASGRHAITGGDIDHALGLLKRGREQARIGFIA